MRSNLDSSQAVDAGAVPEVQKPVLGPGTQSKRGGTRPKPLAERFWAKVDRSGGGQSCWLWTASIDKRGYGQLSMGHDRTVRAHRTALELSGVAVPAEAVVCHHCDVKRCCNPAHLYVGTKATNSADAKARGLTARGERSGRSKLTEPLVLDIVAALRSGETMRSIGMRHGVSQGAIDEINRGENWRYLTETVSSFPISANPRGAPGSRNGNARLTEEQALEIRRRVAGGERQNAVAFDLNLSTSAINAVVRGRTWKFHR